MARRPWLPVGPATVLALLVAGGLGIWSAERAADALGLGARARRGAPAAPRSPRAGSSPGEAPVRFVPAPQLTFGAAGLQAKGGVSLDPPGAAPPAAMAPDGEAPAGDAERLAALELEDGLRRVVRDLEYNREFPEPPQQTVVPPPAPWRPPAAAEAAPAPVIEAIEPPAGPAAGGARVVIRGRFLRPGQVMFGSAPAKVLSASGGVVAVVAPGGAAGPVAIAVTNEDGTFAVAGQPFTYVGR